MIRSTALLLGLTFLAACDPVGPGDPRPLEPESWFSDAYAEVEACAGLSGDFSAVQWFGVTGIVEPETEGYSDWTAPHDVEIPIYFGGGGDLDDPDVLAVSVYEGSLRDLLQSNDLPDELWESCVWEPTSFER